MEVLSVLGTGTIGSNVVRAGLALGYRVIATGRSEKTLLKAKEIGAVALRDNASAVSQADLIVISVKPQHFTELIKSIPRTFWKGKTVVSVMAGVRLDTLSEAIRDANLFRQCLTLTRW